MNTRQVSNDSSDVAINNKDSDFHEYYMSRADRDDIVPMGEFGHISFQKGPIKEAGVNGCQNEDVIAVVIDRLSHFQSGDFKCRENALAVTKLEEALHWLRSRTQRRVNQGVEGTNKGQ